jgi:methionyl-tRNA formyltransferase
MVLNERMDEGDILLQDELPILESEHAPALEGRLAQAGARLLVETLRRLAVGPPLGARRQDPRAASYAPALTPEDGRFDLRWTASEVEGRVRGFDPWPGVWLRVARGGRRIRLAEVRALQARAAPLEAGRLVGREPHGLLLGCAAGTALDVLRVQPEGGRQMAARDAVNGRHLTAGDRVAPAEGP